MCNNSSNQQDKPGSSERSNTTKMFENETAPVEGATDTTRDSPVVDAAMEDISYHAVVMVGEVTAVLEMQVRKHIRTIDRRPREGEDILLVFTAYHLDEP